MKEENLKLITLELFGWAPNLVPAFSGTILLVGIGWILYDLLKTGKKGYGWATILMLIGVLAFTLRVAVSVFREMAAGASGSDWDG